MQKQFRNNLKILNTMVNSMKRSKFVYQPSKNWEINDKKHINQLKINGLTNFKREQNLDYFNFLVLDSKKDKQFKYVWNKNSLPTKIKAILKAFLYLPNDFKLAKRHKWTYLVYNYLLWEFVKKHDKMNLLRLEEPRVGNPFDIRWKNHKISQDLSNSILETYSILEALSHAKTKNPKIIMEIGPGYGRDIYVLKHVLPNSKFIIVDIPPALFISQWYLKEVFPKSKFMQFSDFNSFKEKQKEFDKADFIFLLPHQIEYLKDKSINLILNISSLHEMRLDQINNYFSHIDRLLAGIFYTKQWKISKNDYDMIYLKENDYPVPKNWHELFHRNAKVQSEFFEAAYQVT